MEKLVRDGIPEIIPRSGIEPRTRIASNQERLRLLKQKLIEEAYEATQANQGHLSEELGDVLSVVEALVDMEGFSLSQLQAQKNVKI